MLVEMGGQADRVQAGFGGAVDDPQVGAEAQAHPRGQLDRQQRAAGGDAPAGPRLEALMRRARRARSWAGVRPINPVRWFP
jgi:hypothetical protein